MESSEAKLPPPAAAHRVQHPSLKDTVGFYIRDLIFNGYLFPGERIDQDAIAEVLGVSKLPVREALITLESAALVDVIPRRGAFVARITKDDLVDHYRIYASISMISAERATGTLTAEDFERLRVNVAAMKAAQLRSDRENLNHEFHSVINRAGGSRRLRVLLRGLENMMFAEFYRNDDGWSDIAVDDHAQITTALEQGDAKGAAECMRQHIVNGGTHAIAILEQRGFWQA